MIDGWFLLAGVVLTGAFTLLGIRVGTRNEKRTWERAERKAAYADFLRDLDVINAKAAEIVGGLSTGQPVQNLHERTAAIVVGSNSTISTLAVLGPQNVYDTAQSFLKRSQKQFEIHALHHVSKTPGHVDTRYADEVAESRETFIRSARTALGVSD